MDETGVMSKLEMQQVTAATHILKSQGQVLSATLTRNKAQELLTYWRGKGGCH